MNKEVVMKNSIIKLLQNTWGLLVFALICGLAYYAVVLKFILAHTDKGGHMLGFFFAPLIICGAALVLVKVIKQCMENGNEGKALIIFWAHIVFIIAAAAIAVTIFM
ncbi:MAG: hypothetical protein IJG06_00910 [Clostridia bacterium]|nr:hypothetical protein [Clostridia bacterium]